MAGEEHIVGDIEEFPVDTHKVVKIVAVLASMGGATVTEEATD